nr:SpoIIE family protein phosphatase [Streptomyces roseus]
MCGKGAEAAVVTSLTRYTVRAADRHHEDPTEVLNALDRASPPHHTPTIESPETRSCLPLPPPSGRLPASGAPPDSPSAGERQG